MIETSEYWQFSFHCLYVSMAISQILLKTNLPMCVSEPQPEVSLHHLAWHFLSHSHKNMQRVK